MYVKEQIGSCCHFPNVTIGAHRVPPTPSQMENTSSGVDRQNQNGAEPGREGGSPEDPNTIEPRLDWIRMVPL